MLRKLMFLMVVVGIWMSPAAQGTTIVWIAEALTNAAGAGYDQGWIDLLTAQGYTVDVQRGSWMTLSATNLQTLEDADLVIFSRTTNSGNYASDATEVTQWNSVTTPLLCLSAYEARNSRWLWINSGTIVEAASAPESPLVAVKTDHPIFTGVTLKDGQVDVIDETVDSGQMSYIVYTEPDNGTILAKRASDNNIWIEEWEAGKPFYASSTQTPSGKRMLLTAGGGTGQTMGSENFNAEGEKIFLNAVLYMLGKSLRPGIALGPVPAKGAVDVPRTADLSWTASDKAVTHDIYFGTNFDDVNTASQSNPKGVLVAKGQTSATYDPGILQFGQTYYWRVDEIEQDGTLRQGDVWSFTVEAVVYELAGITATASSSDTGKGPELTVDKSGLTGDQHGVDMGTMWVSAKGGAQPTWIQYDFGKVCKLQDMWVWNYNVDFEYILGMGIKTATIQYSSDAATWTSLGSIEFAQGVSAEGYDHSTTVSFGGVAARYVKITAESNWGSSGGQCGLSEVRFYYVPVSAREPSPAAGAADVSVDVTLGWRSGREAASHSVYLGTDPNALTLAGSSPTTSFSPAGLSLGAKYYWRVDEVNTAEPISTWAGDVWSFTTSASIPVEDMESYNDTTNKVFEVWIDGYSTPATNASIVGLNSAVGGTFNSTTIFHAGKQSMPLAYNNTSAVPNAEVTRTFGSAQDWTRNGVKVLTLYFYGQATNATNVPLWVKVTDQGGNGAKVTFGAAAGEDAAALAEPAWTTWNIPLSSLSGVTLTKVKSMTIGLGTGAGTGTLYIDDIRLYAVAPGPVTMTPTLVGWWKLDNDVKDSSGNGNNGTITGAPTYTAGGKVGAALKLNGTADYVDCGTAASLDITDQVTLSAWIKPGNFANSAYQTFVGKGDKSYCIQHTNGNVIQFFVYYGSTWYTANSTAVTSTMNNSWHHVAGTFDGVQLRLYLDGVVVASTLRTGTIATTTFTASIGRNSEQSGRLLNGEIDEVRIYRGALPTTEVKKLANP